MGNWTAGTAFVAALLASPFHGMPTAFRGQAGCWQTIVAAAGGVLVAYATQWITDRVMA